MPTIAGLNAAKLAAVLQSNIKKRLSDFPWRRAVAVGHHDHRNARLQVKKQVRLMRRKPTADAILQLCADSLSDSDPLREFWTRWLQKITGTNRYRICA